MHFLDRNRPAFLIAICIQFLFTSALALAADRDIVLNEIMFDPTISEQTGEFVEIVNTGPTAVDLTGWRIGDQDGDDILAARGEGLTLLPGQYALILDPDYPDTATTYAIPPEALVIQIGGTTFGSGGFGNTTAETVSLKNAAGDTIARYAYSVDNTPGHSDEKREAQAGDQPANWGNSLKLQGTPGAANSLSQAKTPDLALEPRDITFQPDRPQPNHAVTINVNVHNMGQTTALGFTLYIARDGNFDQIIQSAEYMIYPPLSVTTAIAPGDSTVVSVTYPGWGSIIDLELGICDVLVSAYTSDDANPVNNQAGATLIVGDHPVTVNEIYYIPRSGEGDTEWIELYNRSQMTINLQGWTLTDATGQRRFLTSQIQALAPERYLIVTADSAAFAGHYPNAGATILQPAGWPSLNNTGDVAAIYARNGPVIDSVAFLSNWGGDTGISLERLASNGSSNDRANWAGCIHADGATPGRRNSVSRQDYDLAIMELRATPPNPTANQDFRLEVVVKNVGSFSIANYGLTIFADLNWNGRQDAGEIVTQITESAALNPDQTRLFTSSTLHYTTAVLPFYALATHPADQNPANQQIRLETLIGQSPLVISEIFYLPPADQTEWVEVYNQSAYPLDLKNWTVEDATGSPKTVSTQSLVIAPAAYAVIAQDAARFRAAFTEVTAPVIQPAGWPSLNNTGDLVVIRLSNGLVLDSLEYADDWGGRTGVSLERIAMPFASNNPANWGSCIGAQGATPGAKNSIAAKDIDLAILPDITLDPPNPRPDQNQTVTITVSNMGLNTASAYRVHFFEDKNQNGSIDDGETLASADGTALTPGGHQNLTANLAFTQIGLHWLAIRINVPGDQNPQNDTQTRRVAVGQNLVMINEIMYSPATEQVEWVELFVPPVSGVPAQQPLVDLQNWFLADSENEPQRISLTSVELRQGDFVVLTGDTVRFLAQFPNIRQPVIKMADNFPSLNNSDDSVILYDSNLAKVDLVTYSADWGGASGRSLERITLTAAVSDPENWGTCVAEAGGTPGATNSIAAVLPLDSQVEVEIQPNPFSPDDDGFEDHAVIQIQLPLLLAVSNVYIYDVQGRLQRRLLHQQNVGNETTLIWDGTADDGKKVRIGQYILYVEALNGESGQIKTAKKRLVVATHF